MDESKKIIKDKFQNLPKELQDYITADAWAERVGQICKQFSLPEEKSTLVENEVFFVLIGLEPPSDFKENIQREASLDENTARKIADYVNGAVFGLVMSSIKGLWAEEENTPPNQSVPKVNIEDSFTLAIVNQAKAMRPITDSSKGEVVSSKGQIPQNLPTENKPTPEPKPVPPAQPSQPAQPQPPTQPRTNDPYREPIE